LAELRVEIKPALDRQTVVDLGGLDDITDIAASIIIPLPTIVATWPSHTARSPGRLFLPRIVDLLHELPSTSSDLAARQPHARGWLG
jgi:hypothetical protein